MEKEKYTTQVIIPDVTDCVLLPSQKVIEIYVGSISEYVSTLESTNVSKDEQINEEVSLEKTNNTEKRIVNQSTIPTLTQ